MANDLRKFVNTMKDVGGGIKKTVQPLGDIAQGYLKMPLDMMHSMQNMMQSGVSALTSPSTLLIIVGVGIAAVIVVPMITKK
jgi:hypothetical protein